MHCILLPRIYFSYRLVSVSNWCIVCHVWARPISESTQGVPSVMRSILPLRPGFHRIRLLRASLSPCRACVVLCDTALYATPQHSYFRELRERVLAQAWRTKAGAPLVLESDAVQASVSSALTAAGIQQGEFGFFLRISVRISTSENPRLCLGELML